MVQTQDVLGLGSEARMNMPGTAAGAWKWRLRGGELTPELAARLREVTRGARVGCLLDSGRAMAAPATEPEILDVNRRYHDVAAREYDAKWGISFGEAGRAQVVGKLAKLLGPRPGPFARSLEIGVRHRLLQPQPAAGGRRRRGDVHGHLAGDARDAATRTPTRSACHVETVACDAAELPFEDGSFDLVLGHAVLHHLPALDRAFAEFHRVLRPGGTLVFAGEPSRQGDKIAAVPEARRLAAVARLAPRAAASRRRRTSTATRRRPAMTHHLESQVDVHAFVPGRPRAPRARRPASPTSACAARSCWPTGSGGSTARSRPAPTRSGIPMPWIHYAHQGYLLLQQVDRRLLEGRLPPQLFYNLMLAASKPR